MAVKSLKEQLTEIALNKVKLSNGKTIAETMVSEARRLYDCIQFYINEYYQKYKPKIYERTGDYRRSLYAEYLADIKIEGNTLIIQVGFNNQYAMHPNLEQVYWADKYGNENWIPISNRHESFVPLLMEEGWNAPKLANMIGKPVYRLTYFEGIHAVAKGIADYNKTNKLGIKIKADDFYNASVY